MRPLLGISLSIQLAFAACAAVELDPVEVGKWPSSYNGSVQSVRAHGQHAYCTIGDATPGMLIFDVSTPTNAVPISFREDLRLSAFSGNFGYGSGRDEFGRIRFAVADISNPAHPQQVGHCEVPYGVGDVIVSGNYAYLGGNFVIQVIDVSDPSNPQHIATQSTGGMLDFDLAGNHIYVADGNGWLRIIDVSNPASPQLISATATTSFPTAITVAGTVAYVSTIHGILRLFDVSTPGSPQLLAEIPYTGPYAKVSVYGDYLYAPGETMKVFNVSNPADPALHSILPISGSFVVSGQYGFGIGADGLRVTDLGGFDLANPSPSAELIGRLENPSGIPQGVAVSGNYAYVADYFDGLQIIDVSNPANPQLVGEYSSNDFFAFNVFVSGTRAYVADNAGLQIFDISNPTNPIKRGHEDTAGTATDVFVVGTQAYVADGANGLAVIDVSNQNNPQTIGSVSGLHTERLFVAGNYAFVAGFNGLKVVSLATPSNPQLAGTYPGDCHDVVVVGNLAYVAAAAKGLLVLDVSNPTSPQLHGSLAEASGYAQRVTISGNRVYLVNGSSFGLCLDVIDVSNPANPQRISRYYTPRGPSDVAAAGNLAFVAEAQGFQVVDTSIAPAPTPPFFEFETLISRGFGAVFLSGQYAYVTGSHGRLHLLDISDPLNPQRVGRCEMPASAETPFQWVAGSTVACATYSLGGGQTVDVFDLSDPANPQLAGSYQPGKPTEEAFLFGNRVYLTFNSYSPTHPLGGWRGGFEIIDISDPSNPHLTGTYETSGKVGDLHALGNQLYLSFNSRTDVPDGYQLVDASDPANPQFVKNLSLGAVRLVQGNRAYAGYTTPDEAGTEVFNVTDPANPQSLAKHPGFANVTTVGDDFAYSWTYGAPGLIDIRDPAGWQLVARFGFDGNPATISGNLAFVPASAVRVFDLTPRANPQHKGQHQIDLPNVDARAVFVSGNHAFVADRFNGLLVLDVSDPGNPQRVGSYSTTDRTTDVHVSAGYAFVANWYGGLLVLDVSNPASPQFMATLPLPDYDVNFPEVAERVVISGNYAYVTGYALHVIDISNPAQPVRVGGYKPPGGALGVAVSGDYAYVVADGLHVIDVSNPANPQPLGRYRPPSGLFPTLAYNVVISGGRAYLGADGGLLIVDVSDPAEPQLAGYYDGGIRDIVVAGSQVYATDWALGLLILDVGDPANPHRVGGNTTVWNGTDITVAGGSAYLLTQQELHLFELFQSLNDLRLEPVAMQLPGTFRFMLHGSSGTTGQIQRSSNLEIWADWLPFTLGDSPLEITDPSASTNAIQFYRAVSP